MKFKVGVAGTMRTMIMGNLGEFMEFLILACLFYGVGAWLCHTGQL